MYIIFNILLISSKRLQLERLFWENIPQFNLNAM